jgi:hypothetical protein
MMLAASGAAPDLSGIEWTKLERVLSLFENQWKCGLHPAV